MSQVISYNVYIIQTVLYADFVQSSGQFCYDILLDTTYPKASEYYEYAYTCNLMVLAYHSGPHRTQGKIEYMHLGIYPKAVVVYLTVDLLSQIVALRSSFNLTIDVAPLQCQQPERELSTQLYGGDNSQKSYPYKNFEGCKTDLFLNERYAKLTFILKINIFCESSTTNKNSCVKWSLLGYVLPYH